MTDAPTPGSPEAVAKGCTCPVIDNRYGKGVRSDRAEYWVNGGCPLHRFNAEPTHE